jgi:hypothetical protein
MDFILPPATLSPPKSVVKVVHSSTVGTCQPEGQIFFVEVPPAVIMPFAAYQLYRYPYLVRFEGVDKKSFA